MLPLILFLCALAGAVLVQAFIRKLVAPGRTWVAARRPAASARPAEPAGEIGGWENEGGALDVGPRGSSPTSAPHRPDSLAQDHAAAEKRKAA